MQKILIANRGEIAERIIYTCHRLGIETIAVYSDADADLPYVKKATKAYRIGEGPVAKSYLLVDKILEVAEQEHVDGIHPGYGLLSENAEFAKLVRERGFIFIGPSHNVIALMGDKITARHTMKRAGIPVVPGSDESVDSLEEALALAREIGYPVMLKASGGGGGIGMQRCDDEQALVKAYQSTKSRAKAYFGNDTIFIEKFISNARHIEVQIFGDDFGHVVHLFERDCSIQRRNQKVMEESPSPFISEKTRKLICLTAIQAATCVHYANAGTIEFVMGEDEKFYFLEMNTRLQVEHPVTEMVTGLDLVEWQIQVARGGSIPLTQSDISPIGHSVEFRLYAEDPKSFMPSPGKITKFKYINVENVRVDSGYEENSTVSPFYDPMIAKVIVKGKNRESCLETAESFFETMKVEGIKTNIPLFRKILKEDSYQKGVFSTSYLSRLNGL